MLVLSRKIDESVQIGDHITVTVLKVKGNTVRIGIDAPKSVRVVRGELEANSQPASSSSQSHGSKGSEAAKSLESSESAEVPERTNPKGGLALSDSATIIEFTNHDRPEIRSERFGDSCRTNVGNTRAEDCHQLPLSRFCKPEYQVEHFCISVDESVTGPSKK